jgi:hypothetical protein
MTSLTEIWRNYEKLIVSLAVAILLLIVPAGIDYAATGVMDLVVLSQIGLRSALRLPC